MGHHISHAEALVCLLLNIFFSVVGTFVHACLAGKMKSVGIGLLQIILFFIPQVGPFIQWIVGLVYMIKIYQKAVKHEKKKAQTGYLQMPHNPRAAIGEPNYGPMYPGVPVTYPGQQIGM